MSTAAKNQSPPKITQEGKTNSEIRRCLMRHIARGIHPLLIADLTDAQQSALI